MKALLTIAKQTIRSSLRSRVFHLLLFLIVVVVVIFPLTLKGDATAKGQIQLSLQYSLGTITALLSLSTLWLGCSLLAGEIESYKMHMIFTKPVGRWKVLAGKWLGIFSMQAFLLILAAGLIYTLVMWRYHRGEFPEHELALVKSEVLVGRSMFNPMKPDFDELVQRDYLDRLRLGKLSKGHNEMSVKMQIKQQITQRVTEVPWTATKIWMFPNVTVPGGEAAVFLRYRLYVGTTSKSGQTYAEGLWAVRDPSVPGQGAFRSLPQRVMGGTFHELSFPSSMIADDGTVVVAYTNESYSRKPVIFQLDDGPQLLVPVTGFGGNYVRAMLLVIMQLAFLAAVGCVLSGLFSTPMAIFVGGAYLLVGVLVGGILGSYADGEMSIENAGKSDKLAYAVAKVSRLAVVNNADFDVTSDLTRGRLISSPRLRWRFAETILMRGGLIVLFGTWVLNRRELGKVIRR